MADERPQASKEFRRFFANWFGLRVSDNDVSIVMGLEDQKGVGPDDGPIAEALVVMTPRSAKVLMLILKNTIDRLEKEKGPIVLAAGKEEELADIQVHEGRDKKSK
jgi:hypothetical protein